jgi:hypothetical protein
VENRSAVQSPAAVLGKSPLSAIFANVSGILRWRRMASAAGSSSTILSFQKCAVISCMRSKIERDDDVVRPRFERREQIPVNAFAGFVEVFQFCQPADKIVADT